MKRINVSSLSLKSEGLNKIECDAPFSAESVYLGRGVKEVFECELSAAFYLGADDLRSGCIYLRASGIGSGAVALINGKPIIAKTNCARTYMSDIKQLVCEGENTLSVVFKGKPGESLLLDRVGVFGDISVLVFESCAIDTVGVRQSFKDGGATLDISFTSVGREGSPRAVATLLSPFGKMYYSGISNGSGKIKIPDPVMWDSGAESPSLYKLTVTLYSGDEAEDIYEEYIGLRDICLFDDGGRFFAKKRGEQIFPLAARIWDIDTRLTLMPEESIDEAVSAIADAGIDILAIDSGDFCPNDSFYRVCDRRGMLVARTLPPLGAQSSDALTLGLMEFSDVLGRVANHASLILLLCDAADLSAYGQAVKNAAPNLILMPRAALYGNAEIAYIAPPLSPPPLESAERIFTDSVPNLFSPRLSGISGREDAVRLFGEISERYLCPSGYEGVAYASALASADVVADSLFSARNGGKVYTGAMLDCIYDRSPATTGAALDWSRAKKALFYRLRRMTEEKALYATVDGGTVTVFGAPGAALDGELYIYLRDSENRIIIEDRAELSAGVSGGELYSRNFSDFINGMESRSYVEYRLYSGKRVEFSGSISFVSLKEFDFSDPGIRASVSSNGKRFEIDLIASAYAKGVELAFSGIDAELSDNFFDITENAPVRIVARVLGDAVSAEELRSALRIRSVYDVGRKI